MAKKQPFSQRAWVQLIIQFSLFLRYYIRSRGYDWFERFEVLKDVLVDILYKRRGKYVRPVMHLGTVGLAFVVILLGPVVFARENEVDTQVGGPALLTAEFDTFTTQQASEVVQYRGGEVIDHTVSSDETLEDIANRYGLSPETILWENDLDDEDDVKAGMTLAILPVDGVRHTVVRGETIYTVAKKYGLDEEEAQRIVDYPFNEFRDDDFGLVTGQSLMVPGGRVAGAPVIAQPRIPTTRITPPAGAVTGLGSYVWPAAGRITQGFAFYHRAIDIANKSGGPILAADSGTVVVAGWIDNYGYGNRVMIDHGNGDITLYAHLRSISVTLGQQVSRGQTLGYMGSTGRSTGTHLHFEIRRGTSVLNPLNFLSQ